MPYTMTGYQGYSPYNPQFQKESEKLTWDTLRRRSQGEDIGYDPEYMKLLADLSESYLGRQEEDQLRSAEGAVSRSGLSGNPRVYEAMQGRIKRDTGRSMADKMKEIEAQNLEAKFKERDVNTQRLQNFMGQEFAQGNALASHDLNRYGTEERLKMAEAQGKDAEKERKRQKQMAWATLGGSLLMAPFTGGTSLLGGLSSLGTLGSSGKGIGSGMASLMPTGDTFSPSASSYNYLTNPGIPKIGSQNILSKYLGA